MKEKQYDAQMLTAYLLGSLPAADTERFDELSFTDDRFAVALEAAENDLADKYARGELIGATLREFETEYLATPRRRRKVEFAAALQTHAEKRFAAATKKENAALIETKPKRSFGEIVAGIFTIPRLPLQWGAALAALALVFFGGWLWLENRRLRDEISRTNFEREEILRRETELAARASELQNEITNRQTAGAETEKELARIGEERAALERQLKKQTEQQQQQEQKLAERRRDDERQRGARNEAPVSAARAGVVASFVLAPSLRGANKIQTVSIPANAAGVVAALEVEADEYTAYRAVLRSASGERILWQSGRLKSKSIGGDTRLNVGFPAELLKAGFYSIELNGVAADGAEEIIGDYSFRVVR